MVVHRILVKIGLLVLGIATLIGCKINTDYFSEYRGKNLLEKYSFESANAWKTTTTGLDNLPGTAVTDLYMNWEHDAAIADPNGVTGANSATWRLEVKNLMPNGDFEAPMDTGPQANLWRFWDMRQQKELVYDDATNRLTTVVFGPDNAELTLDHRFLQFDSESKGVPGDILFFDLVQAVGLSLYGSQWGAADKIPVGSYQLQTDFINLTANPVGLHYTNDLPDIETGSSITEPKWLAFPNTDELTLTGTAKYPRHDLSTMPGVDLNPIPLETAETLVGSQYVVFYTKQTTTQNVLIDNFRIIRDDLDQSVVVSLPSLFSPGLQLIPGTYSFSVWVKNDPTVGTGNRIQAKNLTITLRAIVKPGKLTIIPRLYEVDDTWTEWTKLEFPLNTLDFVDFDKDLQSQAALEIRLTPMNVKSGTNNRDAGSLLVASPRLEYSNQ